MRYRILITSRSFGQINDIPLSILKKVGYQVDFYNEKFCQETFEQMIPDYDVLIIGGHPFPAELMDKCSHLKLICKHGAGLDNIPLEKAKARGIKVCNAPGANADAVADLAFGFILNLTRKLSFADRQVHQGTWNTVIGRNTFGKTLGLLGFGAIAQNVARRAKGFNMNVLAYDPYVKEVPEEFSSFVQLCSKEEVLSNSEIVSAHLPLTKETYHMLSFPEIQKMKQGSYLINTSRGGIVDEAAAAEALKTGRLAGAAFDVLEREPMEASNPLGAFENVMITPHIGMYSQEAIDAVSLICAENAAALARGDALNFQVV